MIILNSTWEKGAPLYDFIQVFGYSAIVFSLFRPFPQIYKIFFIKSGKDISYHSLFIGVAYNSLFVLSGAVAKDPILWVANLIMLFINIFLIIITYYFNKKGSKADRKALEEECVIMIIEHTKTNNLKIRKLDQIDKSISGDLNKNIKKNERGKNV